jgi:hypothetical protein
MNRIRLEHLAAHFFILRKLKRDKFT